MAVSCFITTTVHLDRKPLSFYLKRSPLPHRPVFISLIFNRILIYFRAIVLLLSVDVTCLEKFYTDSYHCEPPFGEGLNSVWFHFLISLLMLFGTFPLVSSLWPT